jgi:putative transcriptional regulator
MVRIHLSKLLGERKMTQMDLFRKTKIRYETINAYYHEYAKRVNLHDINKICTVLNCKIEELMEFIPD